MSKSIARCVGIAVLNFAVVGIAVSDDTEKICKLIQDGFDACDNALCLEYLQDVQTPPECRITMPQIQPQPIPQTYAEPEQPVQSYAEQVLYPQATQTYAEQAQHNQSGNSNESLWNFIATEVQNAGGVGGFIPAPSSVPGTPGGLGDFLDSIMLPGVAAGMKPPAGGIGCPHTSEACPCLAGDGNCN